MKAFSRLNPFVLMIFFAAAIGTGVFCYVPAIRAVSLAGAVLSLLVSGICRKPVRELLGYAGIILVSGVINPVIVTLGNTPLFWLVGRPYTLEALLYGANNGMAIVSALLWFRLFSAVMTAEKLSFLMSGTVLSGFGTAFTLTLRYVPELIRRFKECCAAHRANKFAPAAGAVCGKGFLSRAAFYLNVFMSVASSALESSAQTADSMKARGCLLSPKSRLTTYSLRAADVLCAALSVTAVCSAVFASRAGRLCAAFYPSVKSEYPPVTAVMYGALCLLPVLFSIMESIKWHFCRPKT
ncbi:MAG: energy-coupling factor transporter transmembrane protein EcfT [Ruminococcus sp.]|nr:energy-coupling factor transporter transmembrane protein EcfT [Ruminococcus sp.]